jgi:transcriptional regulator with XRE-family HTH domain
MVRRDLSRVFGVVFRNHRRANKFSQAKLSELADVDVKMIGRIETLIRNPSLNVADSLAHALGIPLSQFIRQAGDLRSSGIKKRL